MRRGLRGAGRRVATMVALAVVGLLVGGYIFANRNVTFPSGTPGAGEETSRLDARSTTAAGVVPGQGQAFITGNEALFRRFAAQNQHLGETVRRLPATLAASTDARACCRSPDSSPRRSTPSTA